MQTLGIAEVPLLDADFIAQPRKIASLELPFFRPHAHGHLMKLAKASRSLLQHWHIDAHLLEMEL